MRSTEFEHHLQLVTDQESNDSISNASGGAGNVRPPEEQLLSRAFAEIGTHTRQISPSLEIEQRVMKAFDRELQMKQRYSRNWPRYAAAIAAALLFVAGVSSALLRHRTNSASPGSKSPIELIAANATVDSPQVKWPPPVSQVKPKRPNNESRLARNNIHRVPASIEA